MTVLQDLIDSRDLIIRDGWAWGLLRDGKKHCAMGAVLDTTGNESISHSADYSQMNARGKAVTDALVAAIPAEKREWIVANWDEDAAGVHPGCVVGDYNNAFGEGAVIEMFNVAIAREASLVSA